MRKPQRPLPKLSIRKHEKELGRAYQKVNAIVNAFEPGIIAQFDFDFPWLEFAMLWFNVELSGRSSAAII